MGQIYLKISGGRVLFGTDDIGGYSINTEVSKNIIRNPKALLRKVLVGVEFAFETGVKNPKVNDITRSNL